MKRLLFGVTLASLVAWSTPTVLGFCGFYVAKADTKIFNKASQVVLVRDGDRTVMTMVNDFKGDLKQFAVVIPVPTFLQREQIHVGDQALVGHLDAYSAPRLVEYFDTDPCLVLRREMAQAATAPSNMADSAAVRARSLGVTIDARYTVGEYDILILSAQQSSGLETWLRENGYKIPAGASAVLSSYLWQNMRFFVARVNLTEQARLGFSSLRPLQVAYESPKFMLPIRLGMVNADGPQELFVYALTRRGRVEATNYRTVKLPSDMDLPVYLKDPGEFARFYKAMFSRQVAKEDMRVLFLEYAWDMRWCDPCAADPLSNEDLRRLGVFWLDPDGGMSPSAGGRGATVGPRPFAPPPSPSDVFLTRLHVRYDNTHFPEDLVFQETGDRTNFQGRYVLRQVWQGPDRCSGTEAYRRSLGDRHEQEAQRLATMTGWEISEIRKKMNLGADGPRARPNAAKWWEQLWRK
jgi:hypothetical protein